MHEGGAVVDLAGDRRQRIRSARRWGQDSPVPRESTK
jgi:hypothetical protein